MDKNDKLINEMSKIDFMRFIRREILDFQDKSAEKTHVEHFYWFVRGFAIGRGWEFSPSDYSFMNLPFP